MRASFNLSLIINNLPEGLTGALDRIVKFSDSFRLDAGFEGKVVKFTDETANRHRDAALLKGVRSVAGRQGFGVAGPPRTPRREEA